MQMKKKWIKQSNYWFSLGKANILHIELATLPGLIWKEETVTAHLKKKVFTNANTAESICKLN